MHRANAYLDESQRSNGYVVAAALIPHAKVSEVRSALRTVAPRGRTRLHFVKEGEAARGRLIGLYSSLDGLRVVAARTESTGTVIEQRTRCLRALLGLLATSGVDRVVLDHVEPHQQRRDRAVLHPVLHQVGAEFTHLDDHSAEPMLWIPDAAAWCVGHTTWRRRIEGWVEVIDT